jgi:chemotaxis methyl-accepting protein methylase
MIIKQIADIVKVVAGKDIAAYSNSFLKKTLTQRIKETESAGLEGYLVLIGSDKHEVMRLIGSLCISYTLFFRNSIDVALLEGFVLPELLQSKEKNKSGSVRIWSVGCSDGAETYSLAMLTDKALRDRNHAIPVMVFGTDNSPAVLDKAQKGIYDRMTLQNVKFSYIDRYFSANRSHFSVIEEIRKQVDFSDGDITDPGYASPPAAIFADFDLVSCCNLMMYYNAENQMRILEKLYRSMSRKSYLVVGETERSIVEKFGGFHLVYPMGNIFKK